MIHVTTVTVGVLPLGSFTQIGFTQIKIAIRKYVEWKPEL